MVNRRFIIVACSTALSCIVVGISIWIGHLRQSTKSAAADFETAPPPASPPRSDAPATNNSAIETLLSQANAIRQEHRLREAEILLTRAVQTDKDHLEAWRNLAAVQRDMAEASLVAKDNLRAAQELDRAKTAVNAIESISVNPDVPKFDAKIVLDEQALNQGTTEKVQQAIDQECSRHIDASFQFAEDAYHRVPRKNDRDKVVDGLIALKPVFQMGAWASERIRMRTNEAYSKLKGLVYPEEWNDLLARAGFDPSSKETLNKWGQE